MSEQFNRRLLNFMEFPDADAKDQRIAELEQALDVIAASEWPKPVRDYAASVRKHGAGVEYERCRYCGLGAGPEARGERVSDMIQFAAIPDMRLRFKKPLTLEISNTAGGVIAYSAEIDEWGAGDSRAEALEDLGDTLRELYWALISEKERLGAGLQGKLAVLSEYLETSQQACKG